jgi:hypothetical protein
LVFSDSRPWLAVLAVLLGACLFALVSARCHGCRERKLLRRAADVGSAANAIADDADCAIRRLHCLDVLGDSCSRHREVSAVIGRLHGLHIRAARISAYCGALVKDLPGKPSFYAVEGLEMLRLEAADITRMRSELEREVANLEEWAERRWLQPAVATTTVRSIPHAGVIGPAGSPAA